MAKDKLGFNDALKKWEQEKPKLVQSIGKDSLNFFKKNYYKEGFDDRSFVAWKKKKKPNGKPTLVDTGLMRRSFQMKIDFNKITISNPVLYAIFHNEGTDRLPMRKFLGNSYTLEIGQCKKIIALVHKIFYK